MQLTGQEISNEGIITNYLSENIQQQGIDIRLKKVSRLVGSGQIPRLGKTKLPDYEEVKPEGSCWFLKPGYYEIQFEEGCRIPLDRVMVFISRSSLVRCGANIICGQFDAGFSTDSMGCFMEVHQPILIEEGARIAQTRILETNNVDNPYNGQYQNDSQRNGRA